MLQRDVLIDHLAAYRATQTSQEGHEIISEFGLGQFGGRIK